MGWKLHVDAVGSHPKVFFLNLTLFSIEGKPVFHDRYPIGTVQPKFVAVGNDTTAGGYVRNALYEIVQFSRFIFLTPTGHWVRLSTNPVILNADRAVVPMLTGGKVATTKSASIFDVKYCFECILFVALE